MLDVLGAIVVTAIIAANITAFGNALAESFAARIAFTVAAGAWTGLAAAVAAAGVFTNTAAPFPWIGVFVAGPPVIAAVAAASFPAARAAMLGVPQRLLVGLNIARVAGVFFPLLAAVERLGGPFPQSAGWGDVVTGVAAAAILPLVGRPSARNDLVIGLWNAFGLLDLVAAVALGVTSANGSPLQIIHAGAGSAAVQVLPWSLIPTVLVPFFLITHGIVFAQLAARWSAARSGVAAMTSQMLGQKT